MTATAGSPPPTRRQVRNALWLVGLLALGALPVGLGLAPFHVVAAPASAC